MVITYGNKFTIEKVMLFSKSTFVSVVTKWQLS